MAHLDNTQPAAKDVPVRAVARATALMSAATLVSRLTGFIRTWAMAFALGNTVLAASFSLANNLPNMIYELVAGGILSTAFLPIYLQQRNCRSHKAAVDYASNLLSVAIVFLGVVALAASFFSPQFMLTQSLFSNASEKTVENAVWFFRFFAFQIVFYGISAVFSGLLNAERRFLWPALSSVFMNIIQIVTFFSYPFVSQASSQSGLVLLGVGTTLSVAVMAFVQVPQLRKARFRFSFFIDLSGEGLRDTVKLALPAIACTAINLVALSFMNSCALHVADNGPSSVSYAWMWYQFPYGVVGVALSTAMFTEMSECISHDDYDGFFHQLRIGLRATWALIIPMAALVFACASELIGLYAAGKFTASDIGPIAELLRGWAVNLPLYAGYMYLYRAFSSMKNLKTIALCNLVLTVVQVFGYMVFTGVIGPELLEQEHALLGLALADIIFYGLMLVTLFAVLHHRFGSIGLSCLFGPTLRVSAASLIGAAVAYALSVCLAASFDLGTFYGSFFALLVNGIVGCIVIVCLCRVFKVEEVMMIKNRVRERFGRLPFGS